MTDNTDRKETVPIGDILSDLKKEIHNKAVFTNIKGVDPYITLKTVDVVFAKGSPLRKRFNRPTLAENICRRRAKGEAITDISKRYGYSATSCANIIRKAIRLYTMTEVK